MTAHFILYVRDQNRSTEFYSAVLGREPRLNVPGMTEYDIGSGAILGLMPISGVARLFDGRVATVSDENRRVSAAELYLLVDAPAEYHARALSAGSRELSPLGPRDWGHNAAYSLDPDGYVLAFAEIIKD